VTKYRVQFTEVLLPSNRRVERDDCVPGDIAAVQAHLDRFTWVIGSVTVTEFFGSDAAGHVIDTSDWY